MSALGGSAAAAEASSAGKGVARALASFVGDVSSGGLNFALQQRGLESLVGRSAREILSSLLDSLAARSDEREQSAARDALVEVESEILERCDSYEQLETEMQRLVDPEALATLLAAFLAAYIFKRLLQVIKTQLQIGSVRVADAAALEVELRQYLRDRVKVSLADVDIATFDWSGHAGSRLVDRVFREGYEIITAEAQ